MRLPFSDQDKKQYYSLLDETFASNFWSEGKMVRCFEDAFASFCGLPALAVNNGGSALYALYRYANVAGGEVVVPSNTFYASAVAAKMAGAEVVYADCNRSDLCLSLGDLKRKVTERTRAVCVVHIGGHIAFQIEEIAAFCRERGIVLIEDCAHAHGATYKGRVPGSWGLGGAYSFYATKTMPIGEGGMVVSGDAGLMEWLKYFRNYGKHVENGKVSYRLSDGFNFRMNEMTAALGIVQTGRMDEVLAWKRELAAKFDQIFERRVRLPEGMESGFYKYIVFDYDLTMRTGQVFGAADFGNEIDGTKASVPNSYWIAEHHACPPIWFGWEHAEKHPDELRALLLVKGD